LSAGSAPSSRLVRAFGYPFQGGFRWSWVAGPLCVLLLPLGAVPLLGYSVEAVRASAADPAAPPPPWRLAPRQLADGALVALAVALLTAPFAALWWPAASGVLALQLWPQRDPFLDRLYALTLAGSPLALPWGLLLLAVMPPATARLAQGGVRDFLDLAAGFRLLRRRFQTWNLVAAGIVTGWALGLAGSALCGAGVLPGVFYAILVSAHATAALVAEDPPAG